MSFKLNILSLSAIALLAACSSGTPEEETSVGAIPSWILNPQVEDGIAVSECVLFSGNMSIDKQQALANARTSLAQRIETRVSAMDKTYRDKIEVASGVESGSTFSSVSKQVTQQTLTGTNPIKTDVVKIADKDNLCVLVAVGQDSTKDIFESLINAAKRPMSAQQKDVLYQEFKAQRAEQQLDAELEKLKG
ncbi:LPP20 family lipoprotein [Psychromonas aquimarina]|uniref:LPP20 family lipoprotein n=1 Tax=Psychromonas aquimarina TaxID=444919 RepID=UPI000406FEF4|nr:LPP20 family lipoprotein [Psychromonas aquimarina]